MSLPITQKDYSPPDRRAFDEVITVQTLARPSPPTEAAADDARLMASVQRGDHGAFAALVHRHHGRCFALAWRIMHDRGEAEDAVQEAFLKIWKGAERFDSDRGVFSGWLARIVTNCALDRRRMVKNVADLEDAAMIEDTQPRADRLAEAHDVRRLMGEMPARQRAALSLFYFEGYNMNEVAAAMDSNMKSVESLLSRGRQALRTLVERSDVVTGR